MMAALTNHIWQSTLFALVAGLLTAAFRHNRAHVRYSLWLAASLKFLVPFSVLVGLGSLFAWAPATRMTVPVTPTVSVIAEQVSQPFSDVSFTPTTAPRAPVNWVAPTVGVAWVCGLVVVVLLRLRAWRRVRGAVRASTELNLPRMTPTVPVRSSVVLLEPGIVGLWRPVLLLPAGIISQLTAEQLDAVLTHELCHVRRHDNFTAALHMLVEAVAWFHPLVWWIGARLVDERERACDEEVLRSGGEPGVYAEAILNVCRLYVESPLSCIAGVTGSDLKRRIRAIFAGKTARDVSLPKAILLTLACGLALIVPFVVGMLDTSVRAQSPSLTSLPTFGPIPKFDVVSVKPCAPDAPHAGRGGSPPVASPGRLHYDCYPLSTLMQEAYLSFAGGHINPTWQVVAVGWTGEPKWKSDRFAIEATTKDSVPAAVMRGPMLQAILEDRFKLKVHWELRPMPVYELTVAKTGAKLTPFTPGSCVPFDSSVWPPRPLEAGEHACRSSYQQDGTNIVRTFEGMPLDQIASLLGGFDRPIVNKTGISGLVGCRLVYEREESTGDHAPPPALVRALKDQLGLELHPAMGSRDFIVVDHAEQPTPNDASAIQSSARSPQATPPPQATQFDVVSIKPSQPRISGPTRNHLVGDRWTAYVLSTAGLIRLAYGVEVGQMVGLPSWGDNDYFNLEAKTPADASAKDLPLMLRSMLADRFHLAVHRESQTLKVRTIEIAKTGLKLRPANADCTTDPAADQKLLLDRRRCGELVESADPADPRYGVIYRGWSVSMADIATFFSRSFADNSLVVDDTALKGVFDVEVKENGSRPSDMQEGSDDYQAFRRAVFFKAWQEQAGLDISGRADRVVPVLVIDHLERPTPNSPAAVLK